MFNLGFSEVLIIGVLALLLIGPKQLPEVAKVLGRMINEFKKATTDLSGGLLEMKDELKKPVQEGLTALTELEDAVHDSVSTTQNSWRPEEELSVTVDLEEALKKHINSTDDGGDEHNS